MNRDETLNHVRSKQNIVKIKGPGKNWVTYRGVQKRGAITYNDRGRIGWGQMMKSRNITNWWSGVVRRTEIRHLVLDRGRRWVERHGAERVGQQLLVPAGVESGVPS
jgi:hypothetical protein